MQSGESCRQDLPSRLTSDNLTCLVQLVRMLKWQKLPFGKCMAVEAAPQIFWTKKPPILFCSIVIGFIATIACVPPELWCSCEAVSNIGLGKQLISPLLLVLQQIMKQNLPAHLYHFHSSYTNIPPYAEHYHWCWAAIPSWSLQEQPQIEAWLAAAGVTCWGLKQQYTRGCFLNCWYLVLPLLPYAVRT